MLQHWAVFIGRDEGEAYVAHLAVEEGDFGPPTATESISSDSCNKAASKILNGSRAEVESFLFLIVIWLFIIFAEMS